MRSPNTRLRRLSRLSLVILLSALATDQVQAVDLSGQWRGYWVSNSTGHRGPLRCTLTRLDGSTYRASFSGRFFKIIPFRYSIELNAIDLGDHVQLSGSHHLGRRHGTFYYSANATCDEFIANFESCKDSGQFVLTRCCPCAEVCPK